MADSTGVTPLTPNEQATQERRAAHQGYFKRIFVGLDVFVNEIGGGHSDETISSRMGRDAQRHKLIAEIGAKVLDHIETNHCAKAQASDAERAREVIAIEVASGDITDCNPVSPKEP